MSGVNVSMNSHNPSQYNGMISLINSKNSDDSEINGYFKKGDVVCGNGFINIHTIY